MSAYYLHVRKRHTSTKFGNWTKWTKMASFASYRSARSAARTTQDPPYVETKITHRAHTVYSTFRELQRHASRRRVTLFLRNRLGQRWLQFVPFDSLDPEPTDVELVAWFRRWCEKELSEATPAFVAKLGPVNVAKLLPDVQLRYLYACLWERPMLAKLNVASTAPDNLKPL